MTHAANSSIRKITMGRVVKWGFILCIGLPLVAGMILRMSLTFQVKALEERARERGEPLTLVELSNLLPEIQDDENAALAILDIWEKEEGPFWQEWRTQGKMTSTREEAEIDKALPILGEGSSQLPWNEADVMAARTFAESRTDHNRQMKEALSRPGARYPVRYEDGFTALLPHLSALRSEVGGYSVETMLAIHDGRIDDAIDRLDQMARISNTLTSEPFLISQLVRLACEGITLNGMKTLVEHLDPNEEQLTTLQDIVRQFGNPNAFHDCIIAERAGALSIFSMSSEDRKMLGGNPNGSGAMIGAMRLTGVLAADKRLMLTAFEEVLLVSTNLNYSNSIKIGDSITRAGKASKGFPPKIFTAMLIPALGKPALKFVNVAAEQRLMLIALESEKNQLFGISIDAAIDAAAISIPLDLEGLDLRYEVTDTRYELLAAADDGKTFPWSINRRKQE